MKIWEKFRDSFSRFLRRLKRPSNSTHLANNFVTEKQMTSDVEVIDDKVESDPDLTQDQTAEQDLHIDTMAEAVKVIEKEPLLREKLPKSKTREYKSDIGVWNIPQSTFPLLDDQPSQIDALDFASYVQALKDLIAHEQTRTPFTLGIFGRWGTGKTTLMQMLEKNLNKEGITTIWFNAWQYSNEDELWAAFLQSMLNKIQNNLNLFQLLFFKTKLLFRRTNWSNLPGFLTEFLIRIMIAIFPLFIVDPISQRLTPYAQSLISLGGNIVSFTLTILIVFKPIFESVRNNTTVNIRYIQKNSNYQEHIAFLDKFRNHFSDIVLCLPQKKGKRLAVFIDDLDRCPPERTIQVLDAIKLFVDAKGCLFILGLDADVVQKAVVIKYKDDSASQREYLGKIIQLPFHLPPLTRHEMQGFLGHLMLNLPDPRCKDVFITGLGVNPREIKRTINIFSLLWNLASKRMELRGKIDPVRLAKVVVIQQEYPELHRLLQQRPYLLKDIEHFFRRQTAKTTPDTVSSSDNQLLDAQDEEVLDLPAIVMEVIKEESLRSMLLLHDLKELDGIIDKNNFVGLGADEIAVYFTLTNRVEIPRPDDSSEIDNPSPSGASRSRGYVVAGRYIINYQLGRGGVSAVYSAFDQRVDKVVALKIFNNEYSASSERQEKRFIREMRTLANLHHANIVPIYDWGTDQENLYYVMENLSGGTLAKKIEESEQGRLPYSEAIRYLYPILDALSYIHLQKIIHRDLKPKNIIFDDGGRPYLADFGIMKELDSEDDDITGVGRTVGTAGYMSPEQIRGQELDGRSDLYSFGVTLFETVTGKKPYEAKGVELMLQHVFKPIPKPSLFVQDIDRNLERIIIMLMAKEPKDRPPTAQAVKELLLKILPQ